MFYTNYCTIFYYYYYYSFIYYLIKYNNECKFYCYQIEKQITKEKEKEKIKNLDFAVNNIISDYHLSNGINVGQNYRPIQQNNSNSFPNLNISSFPFENLNFGFDTSSSNNNNNIYLYIFIKYFILFYFN